MRKKNFFTAFCALALCATLLFESNAVGDGIRRGLSICSYSVIPSVFPFMAISIFICKSNAADFFATILKPITKLLKLPRCCAGALLAALFGGYPAAAKCINDLVCDSCIGRKTAAKMLCFCVNAGPPFLISFVGISVFGNIKTGFMILIAQFLSSLVIAFALSIFSDDKKPTENHPILHEKSNSVVIIESISSAAESCFRMCSFIVIACGVLEILLGCGLFSDKSPLAKALFSGFLEVTSGILNCGNIGGIRAVIAAGAISSFSGISVMLQVAAVTDESEISLYPFIVSRFFHAFITAAFLRIFLLFSNESALVFSTKNEAIQATVSASAPVAVSLICMAALFLLSVVPPKSEKEPLLKRIGYLLFKKS